MAAIRYPLRTPLSYALLMATLFALALWLVLLTRGVRMDRQLALLIAIAVAAPLLALAFTAPYRAWPGGHATFTDDALVVQRGRRPARFARGERLTVLIQQVELRVTAALIPIGTFDRGQVVTIVGPAAKARFSTLLVPHHLRAALVADLARFAHGAAAIGPQVTAPPPRTAGDDRLDEVLRDAE